MYDRRWSRSVSGVDYTTKSFSSLELTSSECGTGSKLCFHSIFSVLMTKTIIRANLINFFGIIYANSSVFGGVVKCRMPQCRAPPSRTTNSRIVQ